TVTVTGTPDDPVVNAATGTINDTFLPDDSQVVGGGNLIVDAGDFPGDGGNTLAVTEFDGQTIVGSSITVAAAYGSITVFTDGTYSYTANGNLDPLQVGDTATESFSFVVTDSFGHTFSETLTLTINGDNDAPQITAADTSGSITEDAGPSVL